MHILVMMSTLLLNIYILLPVRANSNNKHVGLAKILGGTDVKIRELPYMLSMELWGHHICGATALNTWWAVTAAHCVTDVKSKDVVGLRAGSVRREAGGYVYCVIRILKHPRYGDHWYDHDIALLQVAKPFLPGYYVNFLNVSEVSDWPPGTKAVVAGWGVTRLLNNLRIDSADISFSDRLKKVEVEVVGNEVCRKKPVFHMIYPVTSRMMCAISQGKDSTQGDSGGPLVVQGHNGSSSLVGIVSWGEGRGHVDSPGVYTRVYSYIKWIHNNIKRKRPARGVRTMRLTCSTSSPLWGDNAIHKVHVLPSRRRRRRHRRHRARKSRTTTPSTTLAAPSYHIS